MRRRSAFFLFGFVFHLLLLGIGCNDDDGPTAPTTPEEPEPVPTTTETFMGALALGGSSCHFFEVVQVGPVTMSITALAPLETLTLGLGIGLPDEVSASHVVALYAAQGKGHGWFDPIEMLKQMLEEVQVPTWFLDLWDGLFPGDDE